MDETPGLTDAGYNHDLQNQGADGTTSFSPVTSPTQLKAHGQDDDLVTNQGSWW